jgi:hypothetical protein
MDLALFRFHTLRMNPQPFWVDSKLSSAMLPSVEEGISTPAQSESVKILVVELTDPKKDEEKMGETCIR